MLVNRVPMIYRKHPKCLICMSPHGIKVDKELMRRTPYGEIAEKYLQLFKEKDGTLPLTQHTVYNHWMHMKEAVETIAGLALEGSNLPGTLDPRNEPHSAERQQVFSSLVHRRVDEIQVIESLVMSGLDELKNLTPESADELKADDIDTKRLRNQVRKDTALMTTQSAGIKRDAANAAREQEHVERSRLVFRLFEIFRSSLEAIPEGLKSDISTRLKAGLNQDTEIRELLTMSQRAVTAAPVAVIPASTSDE